MACFRPLLAYRSKKRTVNGKLGVTFDRKQSAGIHVSLPCGKCIGCRLEYSRQWAVRMMHEASLHEQNAFITLTYNDENLPPDLSLNKRHFQLFMKSLRKKFSPRKIRFYHCGEYGHSDYEPLGRPHYHALLFGIDFPDKQFFRERLGCVLFTSELLQKTWDKGFTTVGAVTWESAAYVARYVTKKMSGDVADHHYYKMLPTGELSKVEKEYCTMSRRPGIGAEWYKLYKEDLYPHDAVIHRGREQKVPRYYDKLYDVDEPELFKEVKKKRVKKSNERKQDKTTERLAVREFVKTEQVSRLKRTI